MQVNALKTFSLIGVTKLIGGRAQIATLSLGMSYVLMEIRQSLCGLAQARGYIPQLSSPPHGGRTRRQMGHTRGIPAPSDG